MSAPDRWLRVEALYHGLHDRFGDEREDDVRVLDRHPRLGCHLRAELDPRADDGQRA